MNDTPETPEPETITTSRAGLVANRTPITADDVKRFHAAHAAGVTIPASEVLRVLDDLETAVELIDLQRSELERLGAALEQATARLRELGITDDTAAVQATIDTGAELREQHPTEPDPDEYFSSTDPYTAPELQGRRID